MFCKGQRGCELSTFQIFPNLGPMGEGRKISILSQIPLLGAFVLLLPLVIKILKAITANFWVQESKFNASGCSPQM